MTIRVDADLNKATKSSRKPTHKLVCFGQTLGVVWENPSEYTRFGVILHGVEGKFWFQKNGTVTYSVQEDDLTWKNYHKVGTFAGVDDHTICFELENVLVDGELRSIYGAGELVPLANTAELVLVPEEEDPRDSLQRVLRKKIAC